MKINLTELLRNSPGSPTALSAVLLAFFAPPLAAQEADPEAGRAIFTETAQPQCALCHVLAEAEAQGKVGPNLDELQPSVDQVRAAVTSGVGVMPAFEGTLSEEEIETVSAYVAEVAGNGG
ncbi:cytochrome c (plasmid) [Roseivivax marinus]|uniref:SorU family sulfite dehydrogenase c-type cytochrome subunit n=1 Tax=Roseivivax marinus TaxID=1379903 RepID=UPI0008BFF7B8|nr:cytochrome c [Roseivivax marinus]UMA67411.1 cytochrome c [Roseivivax marinus]SEK81320.1 sulfite dehydrogenase (cytochrome) subunit SorB [Roseivivax marinus]